MPDRSASTDYFGSRAPGVYREVEFGLPRQIRFSTGVPAFIGRTPPSLVARGKPHGHRGGGPEPVKLTWWPQADREFREASSDSFLPYAVRGFFENGGHQCYVVPLEDPTAAGVLAALDSIRPLNTVDLVCVPDLPGDKAAILELQQFVVHHCETMGDRFAILDSRLGDDNEGVWTQWSEIDGRNGAIYYPWLRVTGLTGGWKVVPPCGHIAGVYSRTDHARGVHKAPANEVLKGVHDLERHLTDTDQNYLNPKRVNCLRAFAGRGIRVWGARTLSGESAWTYVNVRRLFLTAVRWIDWNMGAIVFEPNTPQLWARIERELNTYFRAQFRAGAFKGRTAEEAFYVKCNAETNPPELRNLGQVVTEIGLAPNLPFEFVVVRLIHGEKGVTITGPLDPNNSLS
jgi:phage tail sheath protein FI